MKVIAQLYKFAIYLTADCKILVYIERYTILSDAKFIDRLLCYERRNVLKLRFAQKCTHSFNLYVIKNEVHEQRNLTHKFFIEFRRLLMLNYRLTIRYRPEIIFLL